MSDLGGKTVEPLAAPSQEDKYWATGAHLGALLAHTAVGFGWLVPLVIWLVKKDQSDYVGKNALQALVFHIATGLAIFLLAITCILAWLIPVVAIIDIVYVILAAIRAWEGKIYSYPLTGGIVR